MPSASPAPANAQMASQQIPSRPQSSVSPAPGFQRHDSFGRQSQQPGGYIPQTPNQGFAATASAPFTHYGQPQMSSHRPQSTAAAGPSLGQGYTMNNARGVEGRGPETFVMSDAANATIPAEIRQQFQTDEQGRVLFFMTPPVDHFPTVQPETAQPESSQPELRMPPGRSAKDFLKKLNEKAAKIEAEAKAKGETPPDDGLTHKQRLFLQLSEEANAKTARQQQMMEEQQKAESSTRTPEQIIERYLAGQEAWWHNLHQRMICDTWNPPFEEFMKIMLDQYKARRAQWDQEDAERDKILSECAGDTAEFRPGSEGAKMKALWDRMHEDDCPYEERCEIRKQISRYKRKNMKKQVFLDDIDPRYGPM